ncbi:MAG: enolase C-terminal domain-like protein [Candidatus Methylomirabilales bacterium]
MDRLRPLWAERPVAATPLFTACETLTLLSDAALRPPAPVPLMLDESITTPDDIERAAASGAVGWIKLKLMKVGSLAERTVKHEVWEV